MSIGKRIKFFRTLRGITQKDLGERIGIEEYPRVRVAQYESGLRKPKNDVKYEIAKVLNISPDALDADASDIDKIAQFLFAMEDEFGLKAYKVGDEIVLRVVREKPETFSLINLLSEWAEKYQLLNEKEIDDREYSEWRYSYSNFGNRK